jgi:dTDP-4-amino-4,6-dideoxygalactose transaminase
LKNADVVTILTTSGNFYISGCVTDEIEKFCKWSREIVPETKVIFVNHEFGYPFKNLQKLKKFNLPIIEDCAGSFFSRDPNDETGAIGDYVIYSFPKMFPVQIGGLLVSNISTAIDRQNQIDNLRLRYLKNVLSDRIRFKEEIIQERIYNYKFLKNLFDSIGLTERFPLKSGTVPSVFMFRTDNYNIDLPELKKYYWAHGVQCSVFYGEDVFFIPVHQALSEQDLCYFCEIIKSFIKKTSE